MIEPIVPWMRERAKFNHGWLNNHYLSVLDVIREGLRSDAGEPDWKSIESQFDEWVEQSKYVSKLIERFYTEMSTSKVLCETANPIDDPELQLSLEQVVDEVWLHNQRVRKLVINAVSAVRSADLSYLSMKQAMTSSSISKLDLKIVNETIRAFSDVVTALEQFRNIPRF